MPHLSPTRLLALALAPALVGLAAGCATPTQQPLGAARAVSAPLKARQAAPALDPAKITVEREDGHHVVVRGVQGAAVGLGVWGSPGRHDAPANGDEAAVAADGSFAIELHAHPGEPITLWAFRDDGDRRAYSRPFVLDSVKFLRC
jgi:hypothetical protein